MSKITPPLFKLGDPNARQYSPLEVRELQAIESKMEALRDQFAMAAMQGILSNSGQHYEYDLLAIDAYAIADAMLNARKS